LLSFKIPYMTCVVLLWAMLILKIMVPPTACIYWVPGKLVTIMYNLL
jgi:hypothetical protein